jgi:hypothetical protein
MIGRLRVALKPLTWRWYLGLQILGQLPVLAYETEFPMFGSWMGHPSLHSVAMVVAVTVLIGVGLLAEAAVDRGATPRLTYGLAMAAIIPVLVLSTVSSESLYLKLFPQPQSRVQRFYWYSAISTSADMLAAAGLGMLVFANQRTAERMLRNIREAERRRTELERQLVESRLATAEAQIDPIRLFNSLAKIRGEYAEDSAHAEERLNDLIQELRNALARTRKAESTRSDA